MKPHLVTAAAALAVLLVPALASAQTAEPSTTTQTMTTTSQTGTNYSPTLPPYTPAGHFYPSERPATMGGVGEMPAPAQAFELSVGTGYTQGFGTLQSGVGFPSVSHEGIAVDVGLGYRIDPHWALTLDGQYQELNATTANSVRGGSLTVAASYHIAPTRTTDPFVELGVGWRGLWINPQDPVLPTVLEHGIQLARLRAGVDLRLSPDVAIAPVIGADATMFLYTDASSVNTAIANPTASTFVFAGLQGRFDLGGNKAGQTTTTSAAY